MAATLLSLGTNRIFRSTASWLRRNGLIRYVLPLLFVNEGLGAYRVYIAGGMMGWW